MKKSTAITAVILAVFAMFYFAGSASAGKASVSQSYPVNQSISDADINFAYSFSSPTTAVDVLVTTYADVNFATPIKTAYNITSTTLKESKMTGNSLPNGLLRWKVIDHNSSSTFQVATFELSGR